MTAKLQGIQHSRWVSGRLNWTGHENRKWERGGGRGWTCRRLL